MQNTVHIFTDASFDGKQKMGVAGLLVVENLAQFVLGLTSPERIRQQQQLVQLTTFSVQTNIQAELQGAVWALEEIAKRQQRENGDAPLIHSTKDNALDDMFDCTLYTDCSSIAELPGRQQRLEKNNYLSKRTGKPLNNAEYYKTFLEKYRQTNPTLVWVKGHTPKHQQTQLHQCFQLVDKAVRKKLRETVG